MDPYRQNERMDAAPGAASESGVERGRSSLIYCGFCSALNPASNHFCAACGSTLVDAFHASEGLRVYERPDSASRLIEIVPAGNELEIVEDPEAPEDFVRIRLAHGRLGYIRLQDVATLADATGARPLETPDINTNARGCVTPGAALGALALLVVSSTLGLILVYRSDSADTGILAAVFCLIVVPFLLLTIGLYLYAQSRDERLAAEAAEPAAVVPTEDKPANPA